MPIDFETETLVLVKESPAHFPGRRPHLSTVYRWVFSGRLETIKVGARLYTSREAIRRFVSRCNAPGAVTAPPVSARRKREIEAAEGKLKAAGIC